MHGFQVVCYNWCISPVHGISQSVSNKITQYFQPIEKSQSLRKKLKWKLNDDKKWIKKERKKDTKKWLVHWKTKLSFGTHCSSKQGFFLFLSFLREVAVRYL